MIRGSRAARVYHLVEVLELLVWHKVGERVRGNNDERKGFIQT